MVFDNSDTITDINCRQERMTQKGEHREKKVYWNSDGQASV